MALLLLNSRNLELFGVWRLFLGLALFSVVAAFSGFGTFLKKPLKFGTFPFETVGKVSSQKTGNVLPRKTSPKLLCQTVFMAKIREKICLSITYFLLFQTYFGIFGHLKINYFDTLDHFFFRTLVMTHLLSPVPIRCIVQSRKN